MRLVKSVEYYERMTVHYETSDEQERHAEELFVDKWQIVGLCLKIVDEKVLKQVIYEKKL